MAFDPHKRADIFVVTEGSTDRHRTAKESPVAKRSHFATTEAVSDANRIALAKARAMQRSKDTNPVGGEYGFDYPPSYYEDGAAGPETSSYAVHHLLFGLYLLADPKFTRISLNFESNGNYDKRTGILHFNGEPDISIQEVKAAYVARIAELGLSEVLIEEFMAEPHAWREYQAFWRQDFASRMERFRQ